MNVIGDKRGDERFFILDDDGLVEVPISFIREHPEWYAYYGHCTVNGIVEHTFIIVS